MKQSVQVKTDNGAIDYFSMRHPLRKLASRVSLSARQKMFDTFMDLIKPDAGSRILDCGVTPDGSLNESNFFEAMYPYVSMVTATSIEEASYLESKYPGLTFVQTAESKLPFADRSFDIVVCFAVLEHVGTRDAQRQFVAELMRVGKRLFLTTPDRAFPIEVHTFIPFIHWLPQPVHQSILRALKLDFWAETKNLNLLYGQELIRLFPPGSKVRLLSHKTFGMSSNLVAVAEDAAG